jgi:hypothetical protein
MRMALASVWKNPICETPLSLVFTTFRKLLFRYLKIEERSAILKARKHFVKYLIILSATGSTSNVDQN